MDRFYNGESRRFSNIHLPVQLNFDEQFRDFNDKGPLINSEAVRQTGSGKYKLNDPYINHKGAGTNPIVAQYSNLGPIIDQAGLTSASNNFDPSVRGFRNANYRDLPILRNYSSFKDVIMPRPITAPAGELKFRAQPIIQSGGGKMVPRQQGGSFEPLRGDFPNPAINNWNVGTKIKEPMNQYIYTAHDTQLRGYPQDPNWLLYHPKTFGKAQDRISAMDYVPLEKTAGLFDGRQFIHVKHNPLIVRG